MVKFFNENNNVKKSNKNDIDPLIEMVSKENMDIEEVIEKNKDEILNALPLKDHDDFDYLLFKDILIQVIEKHLENNGTEITEVQDDFEDVFEDDSGYYFDDFDDETMEKLRNLDYSVDTGVIYTEDDNSFCANYKNFVVDAIEYRESLRQKEYLEFIESLRREQQEEAFAEQLERYIENEFYPDPKDGDLENITTLEEVFEEYEEQKIIKYYDSDSLILEKESVKSLDDLFSFVSDVGSEETVDSFEEKSGKNNLYEEYEDLEKLYEDVFKQIN